MDENILLYFASIDDHDSTICGRTREILDRGVNFRYLEHAAEMYGVAAGLTELLLASGRDVTSISENLLCAADRERSVTVSMHDLYHEIASYMKRAGIMFVPLKGCDTRIAKGSRRRANPMQDVDILVKQEDVYNAGELLERSGFIYQGSFSGVHMNFATNEKIPRFIEVHWDLINRNSQMQKHLFSPCIEAIWERCTCVCDTLHLSQEDLLCYTASHAAKEYFHRPKWIADVKYILDNLLPSMDDDRLTFVMKEWGVSAVLGIMSTAMESVLAGRDYKKIYAVGAKNPGFLGRFVSNHLFLYKELRPFRPLCAIAFADTPGAFFRVIAGMSKRLVTRNGI